MQLKIMPQLRKLKEEDLNSNKWNVVRVRGW